MSTHYYTVRNDFGMSAISISGQSVLKITFTENRLPKISRLQGEFKKHPADDIDQISRDSFKSWMQTAFIHLKLFSNDPKFN